MFIKIKRKVYIHHSYQFGWFRFCFYKMGKKICIRWEFSYGWDN